MMGAWPRHRSFLSCPAKTWLASETSMFSLFFIQFLFAGSHIEHQWNCFFLRQGEPAPPPTMVVGLGLLDSNQPYY
jgi:hypothetical protein